MKIEKFEDIKAWQEARCLANSVFAITNNGQLRQNPRLRDQMHGAAISVMANIAEGFDSQSDPEFIKFLSYARRSATEIQSHLYVVIDLNCMGREQFEQLYNKANEVKSLIGGFIRYLRKEE